VYVDEDGYFYAKFPNRISAKIRSTFPSKPHYDDDIDTLLKTQTLDKLTHDVNELIHNCYLKNLIGQDCVIRYFINMDYSYYLTKEGNITSLNLNNDLELKCNTHTPNRYGLFISAVPCYKSTYKLSNGDIEKKYVVIQPTSDDIDKESELYKLASYKCSLDLCTSIGEHYEVEYTESVARFFNSAIKAICEFNELKHQFTPENITKLAQEYEDYFKLNINPDRDINKDDIPIYGVQYSEKMNTSIVKTATNIMSDIKNMLDE
jgi:hypothetical protein